MRFSEFKQVIKIVESKGLFGRIPGDPYVKDDGSKAVFKHIIGLPDMQQGGGQFPSVEERDEAIAETKEIKLRASNLSEEMLLGNWFEKAAA